LKLVSSLRGQEDAGRNRRMLQPKHETVMPDILAQWHTEHVNFARLINLLEAELDRFHNDDSPNYELMLDIMFYMTHYPDVIHHPREDLAFARIKEREKGAGPTVDELTRQHTLLRHLGETLVAALSDLVNGSITSRESVETPGRSYVASFRGHMGVEEKEILPMAARLLDARDWATIKSAVAHIDDPLFGKTAEKRYAALHQQISRQAQTFKAAR
jgi:hemerythrin-like domain-containing protein